MMFACGSDLSFGMQGFNPPFNELPPPKEGEPPLHRAARLGDCAEIRRLVAAGEKLEATFNTELDPGAYDREATPFMVAAGSSDGADVETLRVLRELGADPAVVIEGRSAATFACEGLACWHKPGGDAERLRFVLAAGSPLPKDPKRANRLLCTVAAVGDAERVRVLLEHGLNAKGHWDAAEAKESHRRMRETTEQDSCEPEVLASMPEEFRSLMADSMKMIEQQIFEGLVSAPSNYEIPLFRAAESGSVECLRLLLDAGADARARDSFKHTAMYYAGSIPVVEELLRAGLILEDRDNFGWSPLRSAVGDGEAAMPRIRALIEAGADVNARHRGYTVFMSAVGSFRHPAVLRLLIASGADPHALTEQGYNAFHAAVDVDFEANAEESVRDTLGYLKELGVNIEHRNKNNQTPMARAIECGIGLEVQVLCEFGADPNAVCSKHQCGEDACTPVNLPLLFHAADGIGVESDMKVEALLKAGADPMVEDGEGYTPLMHAVASLCEDSEDDAALYQAFFKGLSEVRLEGKPLPDSREQFVAQATPFLRAYVERFAADIPISGLAEYREKARRERVGCIVTLCAYEGWARHRLNANKH